MKLRDTNDPKVIEACYFLAEHYYGKPGRLAYEAFDFINAAYFSGELPIPLIQWTLTAYGSCLGQTRPRDERQPIIQLHPALLGQGITDNPWGVDRRFLGTRYAFDTLLHECIHVQNFYILEGPTGPTSHNCPEWIGEVNRICPLIGLPDINASMSKSKRVRIDGVSRVRRHTDSLVPFSAVASFPHATRRELDLMDVYLQNELPFVCSIPEYNGRVTHNCMLQGNEC